MKNITLRFTVRASDIGDTEQDLIDKAVSQNAVALSGRLDVQVAPGNVATTIWIPEALGLTHLVLAASAGVDVSVTEEAGDPVFLGIEVNHLVLQVNASTSPIDHIILRSTQGGVVTVFFAGADLLP